MRGLVQSTRSRTTDTTDTVDQNTVKLVWTTTGKFGMAVYTSQPSFLKPHEISAELE